MIPKHKTELDEQSYTLGERAQLLKMFRHFLHEFALSAQLAPSDDPVLDLATRLARAEVELREVRAKLRRLCREHGDNSWDDELCLPDVIEKHLVNPLLDRASTPQPVDASTPKEEPLIVLAKPPETDLNPTGESFQYADDPGETEIHSDVWAITTPDKT